MLFTPYVSTPYVSTLYVSTSYVSTSYVSTPYVICSIILLMLIYVYYHMTLKNVVNFVMTYMKIRYTIHNKENVLDIH